MVLQTLSETSLSIKAAQAQVKISADGTCIVGDRTIEGPGEYDIASIGLHTFVGFTTLFAENLHLLVVWTPDIKVDADDDLSIDAMVVLHENAESAAALIKEVDPRVVVFHHLNIAQQVATLVGSPVVQESSYKLTSQTLPQEERSLIALT
jgi:hypothetical protein